MSRDRALARTASIAITEYDDTAIGAIREQEGITFNAAVRYCIRATWVAMAPTKQERQRREDDFNLWLDETKARKRPGGRE